MMHRLADVSDMKQLVSFGVAMQSSLPCVFSLDFFYDITLGIHKYHNVMFLRESIF